MPEAGWAWQPVQGEMNAELGEPQTVLPDLNPRLVGFQKQFMLPNKAVAQV